MTVPQQPPTHYLLDKPRGGIPTNRKVCFPLGQLAEEHICATASCPRARPCTRADTQQIAPGRVGDFPVPNFAAKLQIRSMANRIMSAVCISVVSKTPIVPIGCVYICCMHAYI